MAEPCRGIGKDQLQLPVGQLIDRGFIHSGNPFLNMENTNNRHTTGFKPSDHPG
jgi:hypothetical protein